ncbi:MAG: hypothetical protein ACTSRZ_14955 [Promethearchaeota archaeon]
MIFRDYVPFEEKNVALVYLYLVIGLFMIIITIFAYRRYFKRKAKLVLWVSFMYSSYSLALISLFTGMLHSYISGVYSDVYSITLPLGYFFGAVANVFMMYFTLNVFFQKINKKLIRGYLIFTIVVSILIFLPYNYWGRGEQEIKDIQNLFQTITSLCVVFQAIFCYIILFKETKKSYKRVEDVLYRVAFQLILGFILTLIMFYLCLVLDAIVQMITYKGYSPFIFIGWSLVAVGSAMGYIGFLLPEWFKRIFEKPKPKNE